jgi:hypothetical protein
MEHSWKANRLFSEVDKRWPDVIIAPEVRQGITGDWCYLANLSGGVMLGRLISLGCPALFTAAQDEK